MSQNRLARGFLAFALAGLALPSFAQKAPASRALFNGKDLSGWETWLGKPHASLDVPGAAKDDKGNYTQAFGPGRDPFSVFTVVTVDGKPAIRISGQVFGGITTREEFSNYHLRLQFKWGEKKWPPRDTAVRDSGLLYHVHGEWDFDGKTWPRGPELQVQEHDVGDLFAIGCQMSVLARRLDPTKRLFQYDPGEGVKTEFLQEPPIGNRCIRGADHEKPSGEWNTVELIAIGDESIHIVNGAVVMRLTEARRLDGGKPVPLSSGKILLQSEGAEIFYRNIEIRPITAVPAEFLAK
jgi:Domain of Unknown Function (DUF1080)